MSTFGQLYSDVLEKMVNAKLNKYLDFDKSQLGCLFTPELHAVDWDLQEYFTKYEAMDNKERVSADTLKMLKDLSAKKEYAYALVAPAFLGQFDKKVSPGKLRNAFKAIGFDGMVEVAVFADILTLKEALEFDLNIKTEEDYQLTSCCCPMWIAMIRKIYHDLMPHVPATVSPMIAAGRTVKILHPDSLTVFIGPCMAKKAEAREPDLKGAIDHVLTFEETAQVFDLLNIKLEEMEDSEKEFSSRGGRIYAKAGGVSEAVKATVEKLNPTREIGVRVRTAAGVPECRAMLNDLVEGKGAANFFEGMGCVGGCVGGPKALIDKTDAAKFVDEYAGQAVYETPIDNPYVVELLRRLGFETPDSLLEDNKFFTRKFD